jgi:hypothetical protein
VKLARLLKPAANARAVCVEAERGYHARVIGEYFAARLAEIDEELVELGPEGRFETVSAKDSLGGDDRNPRRDPRCWR